MRAAGLDRTLLFTTSALAAIGLAVLYSAGQTDVASPATGIWERQALWLLLGVIAAALMFRVSPRLLEWAAPAIYGVAMLVLAVTLIIIPMFAPHYQLLLLPGAFLLLRSWRTLWKKNVAIRFLLAIGAAGVSWAWIAATALAFASFFTPAAQRFWQLPLWTSVMIPLPMAACIGLIVYRLQSSGDSSLTAGAPTRRLA